MARIIWQDQKFINKIFHVTVDESHYLVAAEIPKNGLQPFRPSYGLLDEFRLLPSKISFQALSATLNPYVKSLVKIKLSLCSNFLDLKMSVNRPNITYVTYRLVGGTSNFRNLDFLVPLGYDKPFKKKFLIFVDKKANTRVTGLARRDEDGVDMFRGENATPESSALDSSSDCPPGVNWYSDP